MNKVLIKSIASLVIGLTGQSLFTAALAAELDLSDTPLIVSNTTKPNILMVLDDSGSMLWGPGDDTLANYFMGDDARSKSEIARNAVKGIVSSFADSYNFGLMSYGQTNVNYYNWYSGTPDVWASGSGTGRGLLNIDIGEVTSAKQAEFDALLATEQYSVAKDIPLRNSGGTPIEGTLLSAKDYFDGTLSASEGGPGASLPESCGYDYTVFVTDGLPTVDRNGDSVSSTAQGITDSAAAAQSLHAAGVDTFVLGFALPSSAPSGALDDIAVAGGTVESYEASDAATIQTTLDNIFSSIADATGSGASVSANTHSLTTGTRVYQSTFDSASWAGHLEAKPISSGGVLQAADWDAATQLDAQHWHTGRKIFTWDGSSAVKFRNGTINADMIAALNDDPATAVVDNDGLRAHRLRYIRGKRASELSGIVFRNRTHVLGDTVHSAPTYVGSPDFGYPATLEATAYSSFASANASRTPMVYIGANDGMLHAFRADNGNEEFAYVPLAVYGNLSQLTDPDYSHKNYVDGPLTAGDAFLNSSWESVLVGGLGSGGQSYFALDITDPTSAVESAPENVVKWEFTDADLGYSFGQAAIVKMANGTWAAVFGNGYNNSEADGSASTSGNAFLFIVNLDTGALIKKIDTGVGSVATPNGLATPAPVDSDGDHVIDYIYAGDLYGNLWKFDVSDSDIANWDSAYKNGVNPKPLFVAEDSSGNAQPITTRPEVAWNPLTSNNLILFGTGKYLELVDTDPANIGSQTFYGVNDPESISQSLDRDDLVDQSVLATTVNNSLEYRLVENNAVDWSGSDDGWRLDLPVTGEMVISDPVLRFSQVVFTTVIPSSDVCTPGGTSWLMEVDYLSGGRITDGVIDVNGDADINASDYLSFTVDGSNVDAAVSGRKSTTGFLSSPLILSNPVSGGGSPTETKVLSGSLGGVETVTEKAVATQAGRVSWRQIK